MSSYARGHSTAWEQRQLGEVGSATSGVGFPDAEQGGTDGLPFYKVSDMNLSGNESVMSASSNYVSAEQVVKNHWKPIATVPAIIFAKVGAAVFLDRKRVAAAPFLMDNNMMAYIPDGKSWAVDFCLSVFNRIRLSNLARIGALPSINASDVEQHHIALPGLPEQRLIGRFFSTLDSLIAAAERQETLLRQKKQAYLQLIFPCEGETQPRLRFAGFSGDWEQRQLGEVAEVIGGGTPDSSNPQYWDGDIDWYTPSEIGGHRYLDESVRKITHEGLNNSSAKLLPKGSILFTSRASIGLMAFIRRPSSTNQGFQSLVPSKLVDPDFLFAFGPFITRYAKTHAAGSTFVEISGKSLGKTPLALPTIPEQRLIGQFFKTLDSLIAAAEKRTKHLHALKGSYLQRMFV